MGADGVAVRLRLQVRSHVILDLLRPPGAARADCQQHPADSEISSCATNIPRAAFSCAPHGLDRRSHMDDVHPRGDFVFQQRLNRDSAATFRRESAQHNMPRTPSSNDVHVFPCSRLARWTPRKTCKAEQASASPPRRASRTRCWLHSHQCKQSGAVSGKWPKPVSPDKRS